MNGSLIYYTLKKSGCYAQSMRWRLFYPAHPRPRGTAGREYELGKHTDGGASEDSSPFIGFKAGDSFLITLKQRILLWMFDLEKGARFKAAGELKVWG